MQALVAGVSRGAPVFGVQDVACPVIPHMVPYPDQGFTQSNTPGKTKTRKPRHNQTGKVGFHHG